MASSRGLPSSALSCHRTQTQFLPVMLSRSLTVMNAMTVATVRVLNRSRDAVQVERSVWAVRLGASEVDLNLLEMSSTTLDRQTRKALAEIAALPRNSMSSPAGIRERWRRSEGHRRSAVEKFVQSARCHRGQGSLSSEVVPMFIEMPRGVQPHHGFRSSDCAMLSAMESSRHYSAHRSPRPRVPRSS